MSYSIPQLSLLRSISDMISLFTFLLGIIKQSHSPYISILHIPAVWERKSHIKIQPSVSTRAPV